MTALPHSDDYLASDRIRLVMALRKANIKDTAVLGAMEAIPRELFVTEQFRDRAYDDTALPIDCEQTISQPTVVAYMSAALEVNDRHTVLEVGTGSGYQAAILSKLARRVHTIERHKELAKKAQHAFEMLKLRNITPHVGDGSKGWVYAAPYDRIMVTASAATVPEALLAQLAPQGIMITPVGDVGESQYLIKITKAEDGALSEERLLDVRFVPLVEE